MQQFWANPARRALVYQVLTLAGVLLFVGWLAHNTFENMARQGIASGLGFLAEPAGFGIIMSLVDYTEASSYGWAFVVGLLNTLLVSALGIALATILGLAMGIARLSSNLLMRGWASVFVGTMRNIPLLLHIFFWYFAVLQPLPGPRQSLSLFDIIFLNNRGLYLPTLEWDGLWFALSVPQLERFNFSGGMVLIPEFIALLLALSIYTAAFVAEIVRAGIEAVSRGQVEAASSLGLTRMQTLRLVVLPQAMRLIVPPMTNQYLNLTKNSSLAVAIGYPDLVSVFAGTVLNQTGQAVEVIAITMAVYLFISLVIAGGMNLYDGKTAFAS